MRYESPSAGDWRTDRYVYRRCPTTRAFVRIRRAWRHDRTRSKRDRCQRQRYVAKMLQIRKIDLNTAIHVCPASEVTTRQLKSISTSEDVERPDVSPRRSMESSRRNGRWRHDGDTDGDRYSYCGRGHEPAKTACPASQRTAQTERNTFKATPTVLMSKSASSYKRMSNSNVDDIRHTNSVI